MLSNYRHLTEGEERSSGPRLHWRRTDSSRMISVFCIKAVQVLYVVRILMKNDDTKRTNPDDLKQHLRGLELNFPPSTVVQALDPKAYRDTVVSSTQKAASALQNKTLQYQVATYKWVV